MKLINNLVGFFVGENSKKRQMAVVAGTILILLQYLGLIDSDAFKLGMTIVGVFGGYAVSARLTKISNAIKNNG